MTASLRLLLRPAATADLAAIWDFTAGRWSPEQARRYLSGLDDVFALLCAHPEIARSRAEFTPPVRLHPYRAHVVIYTADAALLEVIRVVHARADRMTLLGEAEL